MVTKRDLRKSRQRLKKEAIRKRTIDFIFSFGITSMILLMCLYAILYKVYNTESKPQKLDIQMLDEEPTNREFSWEGEIPDFIQKIFKKSMKKGSIYNCKLKYYYRNNEIEIGWIASGPTIMLNNDIYLEKASIYSSGNDVVVYGYEGRTFIKATIEKIGISTETITIDYHIPLCEKAKMAYEIKQGYYLSIGEERLTLYKNWKQVGEAITLEDDTVYRIYQNMLYTINGILYMPYIITENGEEQLYIQEVALVTNEVFLTENPSKIMDGEILYTNSMKIGNIKFPVITKYAKIVEVYVPNNLELYQQYVAGNVELTSEMDLGWHSVYIY